uniref:TEX12 protein n=1 Tax=Cyanistes caeruleus TaxID=156563 RepID=A0A8C0U9A3_CYACU
VLFYLAPSEDSQSLSKTESLEKVLNVNSISTDFNYRFLHFSARTTLDSSYVQELDEILKEARATENHLKQKREKLKQRFAVIANTLYL